MEKKESIKVRVGLMDIILGVRNEPNTCAIARAVKRQFPGKKVQVDHTLITISNGESVSYRTTREASRFISKFDRSKFSVRPFTFEAKLINV